MCNPQFSGEGYNCKLCLLVNIARCGCQISFKPVSLMKSRNQTFCQAFSLTLKEPKNESFSYPLRQVVPRGWVSCIKRWGRGQVYHSQLQAPFKPFKMWGLKSWLCQHLQRGSSGPMLRTSPSQQKHILALMSRRPTFNAAWLKKKVIQLWQESTASLPALLNIVLLFTAGQEAACPCHELLSKQQTWGSKPRGTARENVWPVVAYCNL